MGELVLVTGGTGYIATYCIKLLLERGFSVRTTVRNRKSPKVAVIEEGCGVPGQAGKVEIVEVDLAFESGWDAACAGCKHVIHMASPVGEFLGKMSKKQVANLIDAAVAGTKHLMNGVIANGECKRVVYTSSVATISPTGNPLFAEYPRTADGYSNPRKAEPYSRSKILAEQAAWDMAKENGIEVVSILPSYVVGPSLSKLSRSASLLQFDGWFLKDIKARPTYPVCDTPMVDVRDVAFAHVQAMLLPEAANRRFILHNVAILPRDVLEVWRKEGYSHVPKEAKTPVLNGVVSSLSKVLPAARKVKRFINQRIDFFDASDSKSILKVQYTDVETTAVDYAKSCEEFELLGPKYRLGTEA